MQDDPRLQLPRPIARIWFRGCSEETERELRSRMPIQEGAVLSDELLRRSLEVVKAFDERLQIRVAQALSREALLKLEIPENVRNKLIPSAYDDGVNVTVYDPASLPQRIRVEGSVQDSRLVEKVAPVCPPQTDDDAYEAGVVQLAVVVGKDGTVKDVRPLSGPELLMHPAIHAVRQWRYRPTLLNGVPVEVQTTVDVSFTQTR